jgi:c-di-GMP-binding flagellar brake protein YcgR
VWYDAPVTTDADKRRHDRSLATLEVRILPAERVPLDLRLATLDLAVGGARCVSNRPVPESTRLQLTVTLIGGDLREPRAIETDAVVLRCTERPNAPATRRFEVALQFVRMDPRDQQDLQRYLNSI